MVESDGERKDKAEEEEEESGRQEDPKTSKLPMKNRRRFMPGNVPP